MLHDCSLKSLREFDVLFMCNANSGDQLPYWAAMKELIADVEGYDGHS